MKVLDVFLALAVSVMFGSGVVFAKAALDHFPPILLMALRFLLVGLILVWFVRPPWGRMRRIFWASLATCTLSYSLVFSGLKNTDASLMIIVVQLEIPLAALLAWIVFKDPLGWRGAAGMLLAFVGIAIIAGAPEQRQSLLPIFLILGGALTWACGQIIVKSVGHIGGFTMIAWVAVMAGPQLLVCSWLFEAGQWEAIRTAPPIVWITVAYLVLIMTTLGYAAWYHLLGRYDVNQVIPFMLLVPITTILGSIVFLGESLTLARVFGGLLVIVGVGAITIKRETAT